MLLKISKERKRVEPDVETLGTSLLVGANHLFGGRLVVFGEVHDEEPMVVIAALEEDGVGADLVGDVGG